MRAKDREEDDEKLRAEKGADMEVRSIGRRGMKADMVLKSTMAICLLKQRT